MLRMQENLEKTFLGFKFQKIFLSPCTLTSATVTPCNILFQYFTESLRKVLFQKMPPPPHGKILKKGPESNVSIKLENGTDITVTIGIGYVFLSRFCLV